MGGDQKYQMGWSEMLKTRTWIVLIAAAAAVLALLSWLLLTNRREGPVVEVMQDGGVLREIDLSAVTEEYSFEVEWPGGGSNTLRVQSGRICVSEADCPDKICVSHGWLSDQATPIVCLPHRLVIQIKDAGQLDAVVR